MGIKKESTEVRKEQIAKAAIAIIGKDGVQGFTIARVAKAVGVSEANLYRHFKNKDAIFLAVIGDVEETLLGKVSSINAQDLPAIEKMELIFKFHLNYIQENIGIPRIVFSSEALFVRGLQKRLLSFVNRYMEALCKILEQGVKDGSIRKNVNADAMATMLIGTIQFNALRWLLGGSRYSLAEKGEKLWQTYRRHIEAKKVR
ncbi:MAG: TetR/AcrR family transcriptional regulator [Deltaproteobacteria bacterium]|nr:TetR/AcrR family transcriptional regulator [Deltaproteobacteria bacterium]